MTDNDKLVLFMKLKQKYISKLFGKKTGHLYLHKQDINDLKRIPEKLSTIYFNQITEYINKGGQSLASNLCPFCLHSVMCHLCSYGSRHGICCSLYSDFYKISMKVMMKKKTLTNRMYKNILKTIKKEEQNESNNTSN